MAHGPECVPVLKALGVDLAARVGNWKVGAELEGVRLVVRDLMETNVFGELHPTVKKRLSEVVGLLQVYSHLAELEIASEETPRFAGKGYVALPEDTPARGRGSGTRATPRGRSSGRRSWATGVPAYPTS